MYADLEAMVMVVQRVALIDPIVADTERQVSLCVLCNSEPGVLADDIVHEEGCPWVLARMLRKLPIVGHTAGQVAAPRQARGVPQTCSGCSAEYVAEAPEFRTNVVNGGAPQVWLPLCGRCALEEPNAVEGHAVEVDAGWIVVPS